MKKEWSDPQFIPFLRKNRWYYIALAIISLLLVFFYNYQLTQFFVAKSRLRAILLFFLLPLLALLTRPYGTERAIGLIHAFKEKEWGFFKITFRYWIFTAFGSFLLAFLLYYIESYSILVGLANWVYCFSFLSLLLNLIPEPAGPASRGKKIHTTLWGPRQSGKTVFIGMLFDDLVNKKWLMDPTGDEASKYIIKIKEALGNNTWPQDTQPVTQGDRPAQSFVFDFTRKWCWYPYFGYRYFSMEIPDPGGEIFTEVENIHTLQLPAYKRKFFQDMVNSAGALFIIDIKSSTDPEPLRKQLKANLDHLQRINFNNKASKKLPFPVAVAVSQVDRYYDKYMENKDKPDIWFIDLFGADTYNLLKNKIREFKIFYFSAIGVKEINGRFVPRTHSKNGEEVPDDDLAPFGLFEPIKWLLYRAKNYKLKSKFKKTLSFKN